MAIFNSLTIAPEEGTTFIFGPWVCVADGQGGFHLADTAKSKSDRLSAPDGVTDFVDSNKAKPSDLLEESPPDDQKNTQIENFFNLEKASNDRLNIDATN